MEPSRWPIGNTSRSEDTMGCTFQWSSWNLGSSGEHSCTVSRLVPRSRPPSRDGAVGSQSTDTAGGGPGVDGSTGDGGGAVVVGGGFGWVVSWCLTVVACGVLGGGAVASGITLSSPE